MKQVIIMQGVPGSGKSTYISNMVTEHSGGLVVSADHYFLDSLGGYHFDPNRLPQAHAACLREFIHATSCGRSLVVVDNTNTTVAEIAPYYAIAEAYGYAVKILRVECPVDIAAQRCTHGVPAGKVDMMDQRMRGEAYPARWNLEIAK